MKSSDIKVKQGMGRDKHNFISTLSWMRWREIHFVSYNNHAIWQRSKENHGKMLPGSNYSTRVVTSSVGYTGTRCKHYRVGFSVELIIVSIVKLSSGS